MSKLLLSAFVVLAALPSAAQEWPRFRGPGGEGINPKATGIPSTFTAQDYRWTAELPGLGTSSPVLWGTKLFVTSEGGSEGRRMVLCFDALTGKQLWSYDDRFDAHPHHKFNNFASSTPAVDAKHLYVSWTSGTDKNLTMNVLALTHEGRKAWTANLGFFAEEHGSGASPVVVGNVLVVAKDHSREDAFIAGLNTADGKVVWKLPRKTFKSAFSTPLVIEDKPGHSVVIFNSNPKALTCIDPADGKLLWDYDYTEKMEVRAVGSPAAAAGVIFATAGQGSGGRLSAALRITDGKPVSAWEMSKSLPYVPTPLGSGRFFYLLNDTGILTCVKAENGEQVYSERLLDSSYSSPVQAGDKIICISRKGEVAVVRAGEKFEVLGKSDLGEPCEATPALAHGMMFLRTAKRIIAVGNAKPQARAGNTHKGGGVEISLVSENQAIQPGQPFTVGLFIHHDFHRHTYWKGPGLVGVATRSMWTLPDGWKAGPLQWPAPEKVQMAALHAHGYERDVLLLAEITPPAVLSEKEVSLKTKAVWMCCARESDCRPGVADLELTLPVSANAANPDPAWSKAFADARETLPAADRSWTFTAVRSGGKITLTASPASPDAGTPDSSHLPLFFSDNHLICSNEPQIWQRTNKGFEGILTVAELAPKDAQALTGVIRLETGWRKDGKAPCIELNVPLTGAIGRNER